MIYLVFDMIRTVYIRSPIDLPSAREKLCACSTLHMLREEPSGFSIIVKEFFDEGETQR